MSTPDSLPGFRVETFVFGNPADAQSLATKLAAYHGLEGDLAWFVPPSHAVLSQLGDAVRLAAWMSPEQEMIAEDIFDKPSRQLQETIQQAQRTLHMQHPETLPLTLMRRDLPSDMKNRYILMFAGCLPVSWEFGVGNRDAMFGAFEGRAWWMCRDLPYEAQNKPWAELWNDATEAVDSLEAVFHRMGWSEKALPWAKVQRQMQALNDALPAPAATKPRMGRF